jgi:outer membrane protein assembly factor BamB
VSDWPTFLRDNRRSGTVPEGIKTPTGLVWSRKFRKPPAPAWPEEAKADYYHKKLDGWKERVDYDFVFHTIGVGERVWLGSSSEDKVVCLDATTGLIRWQFHTEGPVRCSPTFHEGRLYFGADDGYVYCLEAESGKLLWRTRIADSALRVPGNQRMISLWPVRTDVLIDGGKGHVCAGVFPSQGVYQATLDLKDGTILNKQTLKVTAQGYLERKFGKLMVGTGRNPTGALLADLEKGGKETGKEVNTLKEYPFAMIRAGDIRFAGGDGKVVALDRDLKPVWSAPVEGKAYGLMLLRDRLYVSTDAGMLYCFAADAPDRPTVREPAPPVWKGEPTLPASFLVKPDQMGYCLVTGTNLVGRVYEIGKNSQMQVVGLTSDAEEAQRARTLLDAAGLAGRATVHEGSLDKLSYTSHVFNMILADTTRTAGDEIQRVSRPDKPLPGAGIWTHQYGDIGNTACSGDERVGSELQIQWFGKPGPRTMIDRHHRTSSPLYLDGRMFVPGEDVITGVDAYNGTILWEKKIPDSRRVIVFRGASQLALAKEGLYVAAGDKCLSLDPATGKEQRSFALPTVGKAPTYEWDYVARVENLLIGSASKKGSIRREQNYQQTTTVTHWDFGPAVGSDFVFVRDLAGKLLWTYESKAGLLINQTFTIGDGRFYFVESDNPATLTTPLGRHPYSALAGKGATLVALDLKTGQEVYRQKLKELEAIQHNCFGIIKDGKLALVGSRNDGTDRKTARLWYDVHIYDAANGKRLWTASQNQQVPIGAEHGEQERHPTIVGDRLYCEPKAYDLATGKLIEWKWPWQVKQRRGCGTLAASASGFFFRDETCQAFDLEAGEVKPVTTETRPGCWINMIPAGGLLLVPEGSSGCTCNHSVQTSLALIPVKDVPKR